MKALFLDSTILVLAAGGEHPSRGSCRTITSRATEGELLVHCSVEAIQEFVFHRRRMAAPRAVAEAQRLRSLCVTHAFDEDVLGEALGLIESTSIRGRDAVHAATARLTGFDAIVSADRDFDGIPGLRRVSPEDALL